MTKTEVKFLKQTISRTLCQKHIIFDKNVTHATV